MTTAASKVAARRGPFWFAGLSLLVASMACGPTGSGPDTIATVNAVGTSVQMTLVAGAPPIPSVTSADPGSAAPPTPLIQPVTRTAPPTPLPASPLPPAATPETRARPNGPIVIAPRRVAPPAIDGDLSDWPDLPNLVDQITFRPENWAGASDLGGRYAMAWDDANLYLALRVTDDAHVQTERGETIFKGDSAELLLDADLREDYDSAQLSGDDYQLGLSPGALNGDAPDAYLWFPVERAGTPTGLTLAARPAEAGYTLEAIIPWSLFGLLAPPLPEKRFGFVLSLSDNDTPGVAEQQSLAASVATRRLANPTAWGTLELGR